MSISQLTSLRTNYRTVVNPGTDQEASISNTNDRYPSVTEAIKLRKQGTAYEVQKFNRETGRYERDEVGMQQSIEGRPVRPGQKQPSAVAYNKELVKSLGEFAELNKAVAGAIKRGEFDSQAMNEWVDATVKILGMAGVTRQHLAHYARQLPSAEQQQ